MPDYSNYFQINDIILNVPPRHIRVDRQSFTNRWQTLRTQSSIKSKSGFSTADVYITAEFVDDISPGAPLGSHNNGYHQLRDLVSQFRTTPFCYVDNDLLRDEFLSGSKNQSMALALKQMEITKSDRESDVNVIQVDFHFVWFNYFPFSKDFHFRKGLMGLTSVQDPRESEPWKLLYRAEQRRHKYKSVDRLSTGLVFRFNEYRAMTIKRYHEIRDKEVPALEKLANELSSMTKNKEGTAILDRISGIIYEGVQDKDWARSLKREIFGNTTSMYYEQDNENLYQQLHSLLSGVLNNEDNRFAIRSFGWRPVVLANGDFVTIPESPTSSRSSEGREKFRGEETIMLVRDKVLNFNEIGLIVQGISISFENILATLPLIGHPYPAYQHMGSIDAVVSFSVATVDQKAIQYLSDFFSTVEAQHHKHRNLPAGHRNIAVENDIVNMCGLEQFLPDRLSISNIEGSPGSYEAVFSLMDNPLTPETLEKIIPGQSFTSANDFRLAIIKVIESKLKLKSDIWETPGGELRLRKLRTVSSQLKEASRAGKKVTIQQLQTEAEQSYYAYTGSTGDGNKLFQTIAETYSKELSEKLLITVVNSVSTNRVGGISNLLSLVGLGGGKNILLAKKLVTDLRFLTNEEVPGIERVNEDLAPLYDSILGKKHTIQSAGSFSPSLISPGLAQNPAQSLVREDKRLEQELSDERYVNKSIAARNAIEEARAMGENYSQRDSDILAGEANKDLTVIKSGVLERLEGYINTAFSEWRDFAYKFADDILNNEDILALSQFEPVRKAIRENRAAIGTADCYPDFPIQQVLTIISEDQNLSSVLVEGITALWQKMGLGLKNVGISALINPDFYFFNPPVDTMDDLFPHQIIEKAKDSILASRDRLKKAEATWFKSVYEQSILGAQKSANISDLIFNLFTLGIFKGEKEQQIQAYQERYNRCIKEYAVAPDGYEGFLEPSRSQAKDPTIVKPVGYSKTSTPSGQSTDDTQAVYMNHRKQETLKPAPNSSAVKHRFSARDALSFLPEKDYNEEPEKSDTGKDPQFIPPTDTDTRFIPSPFGPRKDPFGKKTGLSDHKGIDIAGPKDFTDGKPVYAAESGKIIQVKKIPGRTKGTGFNITIEHWNGYSTYYQHLKDEPYFNAIYEAFSGNLPQSVKDKVLSVQKGQQIAAIGNTGPSTDPHLHFEIRVNGTAVDPIDDKRLAAQHERGAYLLTGAGEYKSQGPVLGIDPENESLFYKSIEQFERDLKSGMGYGMMRAYPTFKLYFIESDLGERKKYAFDDFFAYNAVQEIQVIRHRKIAADLCVINLTNISGSLSNRKFFDAEDPTLARTTDGSAAEEREDKVSAVNTVRENPIASLMLQAGTQVQLRLGYSNSPEELETVFNGVIVDYEFSESDDLVTIVCQSFAIELVQTIQGEAKSFGGWFSDDGRTWMVLNNILAAPEVVHFGRWEAGGFGANKQYGLLHNRWNFVPNPKDDNLFPPQGTGPNGWADVLINPIGALKGSTKYVMYNTTIWDVVQEMTLRHPGYIASTVPYEGEHGPRMTLFFGLPDQLYFARDPKPSENDVIAKLREVVKEGIASDFSEAQKEKLLDASKDLGKEDARQFDNALKKVRASQSVEEVDISLKKMAKLFSKARGFIKPFRSYHVATSSLHILHNSIVSSGHNTFNTVTLQYSDKDPGIGKETAELNFGNPNTFTLKADAGIPDEQIREMFAQYPNCVGFEMAKLYSLSLLSESLKESYSGSLVLVGNARVKPFDIVYLFDEYNDCYGPVEVEKVVHKMSQQNGFITEITPDLCVHINQESTMSTQDAMGLIAEHGLRQIGMPSLGSIALKTVADAPGLAIDTLSPIPLFGSSPLARMFFNKNSDVPSYQQETSVFGSIGLFIFRKLVTRTQLAHPFHFSPLVLSGKPMIGGLPNKHTDGNFLQPIGDFIKESVETIPLLLGDTYDSFKNNYWFGHSQGEFKDMFFGNRKQ